MYIFMADDFEIPWLLFQAFHLLFPTKSSAEGFGVLQSPTVACLYSPYMMSLS